MNAKSQNSHRQTHVVTTIVTINLNGFGENDKKEHYEKIIRKRRSNKEVSSRSVFEERPPKHGSISFCSS